MKRVESRWRMHDKNLLKQITTFSAEVDSNFCGSLLEAGIDLRVCWVEVENVVPCQEDVRRKLLAEMYGNCQRKSAHFLRQVAQFDFRCELWR